MWLCLSESAFATVWFVDLRFLGNAGLRWILIHGNAYVLCSVLISPGAKTCQILFVGKETFVYIFVMLELVIIDLFR